MLANHMQDTPEKKSYRERSHSNVGTYSVNDADKLLTWFARDNFMRTINEGLSAGGDWN